MSPASQAFVVSLCFAAFLGPEAIAATSTAMPELISDTAMDRAAQEAANLSALCEEELSSGPEGARCATYRQSMARLTQAQIARNSWCINRLAEASAAPAGCQKDWSGQGRWSVIETLSRKRDPEHWRKVDALSQ